MDLSSKKLIPTPPPKYNEILLVGLRSIVIELAQYAQRITTCHLVIGLKAKFLSLLASQNVSLILQQI